MSARLGSLLGTGGGWTASADQTVDTLWSWLPLLGPAIFATVLLFLIARAIVRRPRYRVVAAFDDADRAAVRQALTEAERRTVGEILPVVVERSDPHPAGQWRGAFAFVLLGVALFAPWLPWDRPLLLVTCQLGLGALGFVLCLALRDLKRLFIFDARAARVADEQALQEFWSNGLHRTEAATGVLLFVSLFEHRVVVLADAGINDAVDAGFWEGVDAAILAGIRRGSLRDGLINGISLVGERLEQSFPWTEGDRNEIPDRVVVREE